MKPLGCCLWLTGLPAAGKTTLARLLYDRLIRDGRQAVLLDGDDLRRNLSRDLGFSRSDRAENARRAAVVAQQIVRDNGIAIVALISPFRADRAAARAAFPSGAFIEIYVDTPLRVCEARDPKGLYAMARSGALPAFTGISSPYEAPEAPEMHIGHSAGTTDNHVTEIVALLSRPRASQNEFTLK